MRSSKFATFAVASALVASAFVTSATAAPVISNRPVPFHPNVTVVSIWAVTASVILDAMYIAATQCREMTADEAGAALLPVIGPAYNASLPSKSQCKK